MYKVMLVDDEIWVLRGLMKTIPWNEMGFEVIYYTTDSEKARDNLFLLSPDAVITDIRMASVSGIDLLEYAAEMETPPEFVLISAYEEFDYAHKALKLGAFDYLIKPFDFDELLARIRAITRKFSENRSNIFTLGDLTVDTLRRSVRRGEEEITLLPKEFSILEYMIRNQGIVLSREQLENQIWNFEYSGSSNNIDGYISRLRKKLDSGRNVRLLHTVRGAGWVLRFSETEKEKI